MQGVGAMSEMKHFVVYNGQNQGANTDIQDQGVHELYLTPYEGGFVSGRAAATMCAYQVWRDTSTNPALEDPIATLMPPSPYAKPGEKPQTWPLNESHFSCEHPLALQYVLRGMWASAALIGSDYPATHSTSGIFQGGTRRCRRRTVSSQVASTAPSTSTADRHGHGDATGSTCEFITTTNGTGAWDPGA
jgi:beta-glucosidase-like glycosyl hydrolase